MLSASIWPTQPPSASHDTGLVMSVTRLIGLHRVSLRWPLWPLSRMPRVELLRLRIVPHCSSLSTSESRVLRFHDLVILISWQAALLLSAASCRPRSPWGRRLLHSCPPDYRCSCSFGLGPLLRPTYLVAFLRALIFLLYACLHLGRAIHENDTN